jgi:hypothetical protein
VRAQLAHFVPVQVERAGPSELARELQVQFTPTLIALNARGVRLREMIGFQPPELLVPQLLLARAQFAFRASRPLDANALLRSVLEALPESPFTPEAWFWLGVGEARAHKGDKKPMYAVWDKLVTAHPTSPWSSATTILHGGTYDGPGKARTPGGPRAL